MSGYTPSRYNLNKKINNVLIHSQLIYSKVLFIAYYEPCEIWLTVFINNDGATMLVLCFQLDTGFLNAH